MRKSLEYLASVVAIGAFVGWNLLYFTGGCTRPMCRVVGVYRYEVRNLNDYIDYVAGEDLYRIHSASSLTFSCDEIRDQLSAHIHSAMFADAPIGNNEDVKAELDRLEILGAKRESRTLHLMNGVTVGSEELGLWAEAMREVIRAEPKDKKDNWLPEVLRRLFDSVILHAGDEEVEIPIRQSRYKC